MSFKNSIKEALKSFIASIVCILLGLLIGYVALLIIEPSGAKDAIVAVVKNFMNYSREATRLRYFGDTLVKTAPLLLCSLSILFSYKAGLFNIGAAGQYVAGTVACLYSALKWDWGWLPCMLFAILCGALVGALSGALKAYCNVNEVISGIMLNWILLYSANMILENVKEVGSPYTVALKARNSGAMLPSLGLGKYFNNNKYVTIAIPLAIVVAVAVWVVLTKTKFGYELKATGFNKNAAKYCGMAEKRNIVLTLAIGGALAGLGASLFYQTGYEQWECTVGTVPAMGFNGISAAFLGGLNPIGAIFSSFFIQHITIGGSHVDLNVYCSQISELISAIIIYLCGFVMFMKYLMDKGTLRIGERFGRKKKGGDE